MHFHLPKPLHGWRAFAGEVGIIVVGVLIALGAKQVVDTIHDRAEVRDAEGAMVAELRDDNLPQAYTRAAIFNCYADQLDAIQAAIASGDRAKLLKLASAYHPVARTYDDQAWQAAVASQVLIHSGATRMLAWSTAYRLVPNLNGRASTEQEMLADLHAPVSGEGPLSAVQQDRLFGVVSKLRRLNEGMTGTSLVFINYLAEQHLALTRSQEKAIQNDARRTYGDCVVEPKPERVSSASQLIVADDAMLGRK